MNAEQVISLVMAMAKMVAIEFGIDDAAVLRFAAMKLPELLPSPKDELTGYEAARKVAESTR